MKREPHSIARTGWIVFLGLVLAMELTGCAAMLPSRSTGTSVLSFDASSGIPKRFVIRAPGDQVHDPVRELLAAELLALGFVHVHTSDEPDVVVAVEVKTSDFSPVHLSLALSQATTGQVLWQANVSREWDLYTSIVDASKSNVRKAIRLLRDDLALKE